MVGENAGEHRSAWPGVALTVIGMLATAVATTLVIQSGGSATTVEQSQTAAPTRTVVATAGPAGAQQAQPRIETREFVYTVAGNQRPNDPVTVVYADETGALRVAENVILPWTLTVVPTLPVTYVTANSTGSQLNCWITDAAGATVASQTLFSPSTTCHR